MESRAMKRVNVTHMFRNRFLFLLDAIWVFLAHCLIQMCQQNIYDAIQLTGQNIVPILISIAYFILVLGGTKIYSILWILSGTQDYVRLLVTCIPPAILTIATNLLFFKDFYPKTYIYAMVLSCFGILSIRLGVRAAYVILTEGIKATKYSSRLMIIGTGASAMMAVKDIAVSDELNYEIVCFIDADSDKWNKTINGIKVIGGYDDIKYAADEWMIDVILFAEPNDPPEQRRHILELCNDTGCEVKILPGISEMLRGTGVVSQAKKIEISDLLAREPIQLDNDKIGSYIEGKTILVTGGGGSIGSELCRQIMKYNPSKLVILDIYENNAYDLQMELNRLYPENKPDVVIASVRDKERLRDVFDKYRPYIVFHAAAHKHVPLMEDSPGEAIKNNVFGTLNTAQCAEEFGVKRFVMISTDKAVNPTNVMGATKRICEMIVQTMQRDAKTEFVAVRFGNVLGSNGSVVPLFGKQIEEGGPVTVTHREITRFFMTIPEAAELVLQAASYAKGGEIFVLDMGAPVKIYDLAKSMIRMAGYVPDKDIKIKIIGLRPGEKLYEELLMNEEGLRDTAHKKIFIGKPIDVDADKLSEILDKLHTAAFSDDNEAIKEAVAEAVPTYKRVKESRIEGIKDETLITG